MTSEPLGGDVSDDLGRKLVRALDNGIGARVSRLFIIVILPAISVLAGYAAKVTLEKIDLQQQYIMQRQDDILSVTRSAESRLNTLETNVGRIQEHEAATDQRLTRLEGRK